MSLPPLPWHYETTALVGQPDGAGHVYLVDADGKKRASIWGPAEQKIALADFIIAASESPDGKAPQIIAGVDGDARRLLAEGLKIWTADESDLSVSLANCMDAWCVRVRTLLANPPTKGE